MARKYKSLFAFCLLIMSSFYCVNAKVNVYAANRDAGKYIALTFDDGPHPVYTEKILDILNENDAKGTFFVVGKNAESYPELLLREHNEGHEIGNHTYSHPDMNKISADRAVEEILLTQGIIENITGKRPVLFRAPGGNFSDELVLRMEKLEYKPVSWSWRQDTLDWKKRPACEIVNAVISNIQNGDIILFHDFNTDGSPTPEALEILIPKLKSMGFSFVTVSELLSLNQLQSTMNK